MNWPKGWLYEVVEWLDDARGYTKDDDLYAEADKMLRAFHFEGMLKDPPKPKEFWLCSGCEKYWDEEVAQKGVYHKCVTTGGKIIHVREVLSDE